MTIGFPREFIVPFLKVYDSELCKRMSSAVILSATNPNPSNGRSGERRSTFLKLTDADARAFAEYQSMLRQRCLPS